MSRRRSARLWAGGVALPLVGAVLFAATFAAAPALRAAEVPYLTGRVVDEAGILSPAARERIEAALTTHEENTTNQVAVLTIPSLGSDSVEEFAVRVFSTWKLGRKGKDNGVLLVVVPQERRMRIEVGYGLEGTLTDGAAGTILRTALAPRFKAGDYDGGIEAGVGAILAVLEGRGLGDAATAEPEAAAKTSSGSGNNFGDFKDPDIPWPMRILLGAFIFGIIGLFTVMGVLTPGMGWFLYVFLIPFWAMFPIVVVGVKGALVLLVTYVIGFPVAKLIVRKKPWYTKAAKDLKSKGSATVGGMVITSGGSSWSGGGGGGGFSGGGGSSGGGGASGSW